MITTKTTALLVAMALVGAAPTAINAFADNLVAVNQEDNDEVEQENKAEIEQESGQANIDGGDVVDVGDQTNNNVQVAAIGQSNTNTDNDVQNVQAVQVDNDVCGILQLLSLTSC
jgi:hypothetical protein